MSKPGLFYVNQMIRPSAVREGVLKFVSSVRRDILEIMGYDFNRFSSIFVTKSRSVYYLCYDYAFTPILNGKTEKALIVQHQDYMKRWDPWARMKKAADDDLSRYML